MSQLPFSLPLPFLYSEYCIHVNVTCMFYFSAFLEKNFVITFTFLLFFAGMENFYGGDRPSSRGRVKNRMRYNDVFLIPSVFKRFYIIFTCFFCHFLRLINSFENDFFMQCFLSNISSFIFLEFY